MDDAQSNQASADDAAPRSDAPVVDLQDETADATASDGGRPGLDGDRPFRVAAWLIVVGSLALAGLLFAIPAHVYDRGLGGRVIPRIRRIDVVELWRVQANNLPEIGRPAVLETLFVGCALVFVVGTAYLIWIAMVDVRPPPRRAVHDAGRSGESESV